MPIIKDWIFVHIPRTGGTYIESLFNLQWEADSDKDDNERIKYHFIPQHFYTHDANNRQMVDVICHYEAYDVKTFINKQFDVKSEFNPPRTEEYYNPFLGKTEIQLINKIYEKDFAAFNYEKR